MKYTIRFDGDGALCEEGPFDSADEAQRFIDAEVGVPAHVEAVIEPGATLRYLEVA